MSDFERYGWEPDGSRSQPATEPPPAPVRTEESGSTGLALLAGLVAAIAGGTAWGLISKYTDYEVGIVAWGIGFLTGFAVERAAGGRRSPDLQAIAVVTALLGVLLGKYLGFAFAVQEAEQHFGTQTGLLSGEMFSLFRHNLGEVFGLCDLLWTALAVGSAWYALRPEQAEAAPEAAPTLSSLPESFPEPFVTPLEPAPEPKPEHHSRNPVDRLTRGLPHGWRVTIDWVVTIVGAIAIVLAIKAWVVNPYRIPSSSMEPTLHCARPASGCEARFSDRVLANRFIYRFRDPRRGEVVVFQTPPAARQRCGAGGTFVKRLIGLPGDRVELRNEGGSSYVYINGKKLDEPYIEPDRRDTRGAETYNVPQGQYFMMGDNRDNSEDSRYWGFLPREYVKGKALFLYISFGEGEGSVANVRWARILRQIH